MSNKPPAMLHEPLPPGVPAGYVAHGTPMPWQPSLIGEVIVGRLSAPITMSRSPSPGAKVRDQRPETFRAYVLRKDDGTAVYLSGVSMIQRLDEAALRPGAPCAIRYDGQRRAEVSGNAYRCITVYTPRTQAAEQGHTPAPPCDEEGDEPPM